MWDVAYTATETTSDHEVIKQIATLTREVELLRIDREQQAHHGWTCHPNLVWGMSDPYDDQDPSQSCDHDWPNDPMLISNQDFCWSNEYTEYQHPPTFSLCKPSLEETLQAFMQSGQQRIESVEASVMKIETQVGQLADTVGELVKIEKKRFVQSTQLVIKRQTEPTNAFWEKLPQQNDGEEWSWPPVDAQAVTTFEGGTDIDVDAEEEQRRFGASYEALHLVEPIVVEVADELCYPYLTDEQRPREENSQVFGFPEITSDFFSFQNYYFIPSASFLKNCPLIDVDDFVFNRCFLQVDDMKSLWVGLADEREEDELIQVMEWLKLESEFG